MFGFDSYQELSKPRDLEKSLNPQSTFPGAASAKAMTHVLSAW